MAKFGSGILRAVLRPANIPAFIAFLVMVAGGLFAEHQNNHAFQQSQRAEIASQLGVVRARVEGNISANIQLVRGLVAAIATEPDMDQQRFSELAGNILDSKNQLLNLAAAPGMVISMVHPIEGNKAVLGLDYRKNKLQREAALRVERTGNLVLAGPVDLVQGGQGFIGRFPVFVRQAWGEKKFWGIVSAVIDSQQLFFDSGLHEERPVDFAIRGWNASGASGEPFYGKQEVFTSNPVTADIVLPSGSWQIAGIPKDGWQTAPDSLWALRGLALLAILLVVLPILFAAWLYDERVSHVEKLEDSARELKHISHRFEHALSVSNVGVWEYEMTAGKIIWDQRMRTLMGAPPNRTITLATLKKCIHKDDFPGLLELANRSVELQVPYNSEFRSVLPDGTVRFIRSSGTVANDSWGNTTVVGISWDITADVRRNEELQKARRQSEVRNAELEETKARIEHNALHDALTELPNRRYLDDVLNDTAQKCGDKPHRCGVLHLDLDRFKQINDSYGHAAGDAMLRHTANVLRGAVQKDDFVARIGGDEFVIVCLTDAMPERLEALAADIVVKMREPVKHDGRECRFGVSVGIACADELPDDPRQMLINADIALYRAKKEGRNGYKFFTQDLHKAAISTKRLADEVLVGMDLDQFKAYYQPQFDARTREVIGVEALVRWQHPERGLQSPAHFLEIAEDLSIMGDLDARVLEQSLEQMARWKSAGVNIPRVAVNVSARRLHDEDLVPSLQRLAIEPGTITFELVESIYLDNNDDLVANNLDQIKELGIDLELDDFGTGHTSIVSLMKLRPSRLKIDRQLILPTTRSKEQRDLVRSIVHIGNSLGIESLAEGVETEEHAQILDELGCAALQGYALARPMTGHQVTRFMRLRADKNKGKKTTAA